MKNDDLKKNKLILYANFFRYWVEWESPVHTILVLIGFVVACQFFEPYMTPIALLLVFFKYYVAHAFGGSKTSDDDEEQQTDEDDQQDDQQDDQDDEKTKVTIRY